MTNVARLPQIDHAPGLGEGVHVPRLRTRFYAFLSYSHKDKEFADWLHAELEKFRVPHSLAGKLTANGVVPRRLTPIFRDQQDLSAGGDLADEIKAALAASQFLIVLCSPTCAKSRWTNQEIESFKRTRPEGCVLAAVVAGEPFASDRPGREHEECFPPALRFKYDRRGHQTSKRADPMAADFRPGGEGRRLAFLKLVAGMLGVGLDELVRREQTRRQRRLAYLAAAAIAGMAITSILAVAAIEGRNAAREQRREAESLVAFMVGDLRDKLEPIGRLDVLDGVGSRVLKYYSRQDTSQLSDDGLVQRSRALNLLGEVAFDRGKLQEAEGLYRQAMAGTAEAVRRAPNDAQRLFDHAQNVFYVGEVERFAGHPAEAERAWREYKRLADEMAALQPDNLRYRMEVFYADEDVAISLYYQHRFAEADRLFETAEEPMEKLASLEPANATYQKEFAQVLAWMADAERSQGHLPDAVALRGRQIDKLDQLLTNVVDSKARSMLVTAHEALAFVLSESGQTVRSVTEFRSAVAGAEALMVIEPHNAVWKKIAADAHLQLALQLFSIGRRDEAMQQAAAGCALAAGLPKSDASASSRLAMSCAMLRARLALADGRLSVALSYSRQALAAAQGAHSEDPISDRYKIAQVEQLVGDVLQQSGDPSGAWNSWTSALAVLPGNVAERPFEMNERLQLLRRLNRASDASSLQSRLNAIGYRSTV